MIRPLALLGLLLAANANARQGQFTTMTPKGPVYTKGAFCENAKGEPVDCNTGEYKEFKTGPAPLEPMNCTPQQYDTLKTSKASNDKELADLEKKAADLWNKYQKDLPRIKRAQSAFSGNGQNQDRPSYFFFAYGMSGIEGELDPKKPGTIPQDFSSYREDIRLMDAILQARLDKNAADLDKLSREAPNFYKAAQNASDGGSGLTEKVLGRIRCPDKNPCYLTYLKNGEGVLQRSASGKGLNQADLEGLPPASQQEVKGAGDALATYVKGTYALNKASMALFEKIAAYHETSARCEKGNAAALVRSNSGIKSVP